MGVAVGNLWLVQLATFILQPMEHTNHKFPTATATGVPCEVKSTVATVLKITIPNKGYSTTFLFTLGKPELSLL